MPQAIPVFLASVASQLIAAGSLAITSAIVTKAAVLAGVVYGTSLIFARKNRGGPTANLGLRRSFTQLRNPEAPRHILYGTAQYSPSMFMLRGVGDKADNRFDFPHHTTGYFALSTSQVDCLNQIYLDASPFLVQAEASSISSGGQDGLRIINTDVPEDNPDSDLYVRRKQGLDTPNSSSTNPNPVARHWAYIHFSRRGGPSAELWRSMERSRTSHTRTDNTYLVQDAFALPEGFTSWEDTEMRATGLPWLVISFKWDRNPANTWAPYPQITILATRTAKNYTIPQQIVDQYPVDFRTTHAKNAALAAYDYIINYTPYVESDVDMPTFKKSIDECHRRGWEANGVVTSADDPDAVLGEFVKCLGANGGAIYDSGGKLFIDAARSRLPVMTITPDMISGGEWTLLPSLPRDERFSAVSISYVSPPTNIAHASSNNSITLRHEASEAELGERLEEIDCLLISEREHVVHLAGFMLERQLHARQLTLNMNAEGLRLKPGDIVNVTLPAPDGTLLLDEARFNVSEWSVDNELVVSLTLYEDNIAAYEKDYAADSAYELLD